MSHKLPMVSGENLIKFLSKRGFEIRTQSSSHIVLQKDWIVLSVPLHSELKKGTPFINFKAGWG